MLGIDIVDLKDPLLGKRDERSLKLIKNESDNLTDHPNAYWLLWSAKEAVFKCCREALNFSPTSIPIKIDEKGGSFTFCSEAITGQIYANDEYILCVCSDDMSSVEHQVFESTSFDSETLRSEILDFFQNPDFSIGSDELNLPVILPANEAISLSHHGRFGAFAYPKSILNL